MPHQSAAQASRQQITEQELAEGFARLVNDEWRLCDAEAFVRRVKALPSMSAPYLVTHLVSGGPKEREVATALLQLLAGPRVIVPLRQVLKSKDVSDEARMCAALVLDRMGEPVDIAAIASAMRAPKAVFEAIWETILDRSEDEEAFLEALLGSMEEGPSDMREEVVRSLAEPRDPRALRLLRPLLSSKRTGTVIAAIEAVEGIRGTGAIDALKEMSDHDPSPTVRKRSRIAYGRLFMMSGAQLPGFGYPAPPPARTNVESPLPLYGSWMTLVDGRGHQGVVVARKRPDGAFKVLSVIISDTEGIKQVLGAEKMSAAELEDAEIRLRSEGLERVGMSLDACRSAVEEARRLTLRLKMRPPMGLEIWRGMLAGPSGIGITSRGDVRLTPSNEQLLSYIPETGALLTLAEFRQWLFDADLVYPYVDEWDDAPFERQAGPSGEATLTELVNVAAGELFKGPARLQWSLRLRRQALLLEKLGKPEAARLAASAALGLDPVAGVPLELHPFVKGVVLHSFYAAGLRAGQPGLPSIGV